MALHEPHNLSHEFITDFLSRMALFAAGFNAWNQLSFDASQNQEAPNDLFNFVNIFEGDKIERPISRLTYTLLKQEDRIHAAGAGYPASEHLHTAYAVAKAANGEVLAALERDACIPVKDGDTRRRRKLAKFASMSDAFAGKVQKSWNCSSAVRSISAYNAGFVVLYHDGSVATLGDARFPDCLGCSIAEPWEAAEPGIVYDLSDLRDPIKHVSAGEWTLAALTESGALYIWGGGVRLREPAFTSIDKVPNYVEVDGGKDVQDVALGEYHTLALTMNGCVYGIGDNTNGQLGMDREEVDRASSCRKLSVPLADGHRVSGVSAGRQSSFVLTSTEQKVRD